MFQVPVIIQSKATSPTDWDKSTADTINEMRALIRKECESPVVLDKLSEMLSPYGIITDAQVCRAVWFWIARTMEFRSDEDLMQEMGIDIQHPTKELLIAPTVLLQMTPRPMGDCDDFTDLCLTMLTAWGVPCSLITIAADDSSPGKWSHVYGRAYPRGGSPMYMDCSHGLYPGWETDYWTRKREWFV